MEGTIGPTGSGHIHREHLLSTTITLEKPRGHLHRLNEVLPLQEAGELPTIRRGQSRCIRLVEVVHAVDTGTSDDRLLRHRCHPSSSRTGIGIEEAIGLRMSGTSGSHRRRGEGEEEAEEDGMNISSTMIIMSVSVVGLMEASMGRPDISIGEASGTRNILAAIAPTVTNAPPGAAIVTSTITRKNAVAVATPHAAVTHPQWGEVRGAVHLLRHAIVAIGAVRCSTITNRRCHLSMTSAAAAITAVPEVIAETVTTDHLRPGWIVVAVAVEDGSNGEVGHVARSEVVAAEWIVVTAVAVVGTTRMSKGTKWTTTGSRHRVAIGKVAARGESEVARGHPTEGLRRGRDRASGTGIGVGVVEDGLVRRQHR